MKDKKYQITRFITLFVQFALMGIGLCNTIIQIVNFGSNDISSQNIVVSFITLVVYISMINYAIWGYKKKYVPYRISITCYLMLLMATFVRLVDVARAGKESTYIGASCFLIAVIMCLVIAFDNTFKDRKPQAKAIGAVIIVLELIIAIGAVIVLNSNGLQKANDIMAYQPFSRFIISSVLYVSFVSRTYWRNHNK